MMTLYQISKKKDSSYVAELARLVSIVKNKMPPPGPTFWKKVDENQVCYFIWPYYIMYGQNLLIFQYLPVFVLRIQ